MTTAGTQHMTFDEFVDGFAAAKPGATIVYAVGRVATSISNGVKQSEAGAYELRKVCEMALRHQTKGHACLTQKKREESVYEYRCVKSHAPDNKTERKVEPCELSS